MQMLGRKLGMTHVFDEKGRVIPCTVIHVKPHVVSQKKSLEKDGYQAIQLSTEKLTPARRRNWSKPLLGHFEKNGIEPRRYLLETRVENSSSYEINQEVDLSFFSEVASVDVSAISKGKGYQGAVKRYGFKGFGPSHGEGPIHRHVGSTGQRSTIGRTWKGRRMAGHMGAKKVTVQSLSVVRVDVDRGVLLVKGAVPGANNGLVRVSRSVKN